MAQHTLPDQRLDRLARRLTRGDGVGVTALAREFEVSVDTIRRDLARLEAQGRARRVHGGALPATPAPPLSERPAATLPDGLIAKCLAHIGDALTLILDGGTATAALANALPPAPGRLVITPAPHIATITLARGIDTIALGGPLSPRGGIATGNGARAGLAEIAADMAILGACGLDPTFGLSADDLPEAEIKRAMAAAARHSLVITDAAKLGRRARHRVLPPEAIHAIATDADPGALTGFEATTLTP